MAPRRVAAPTSCSECDGDPNVAEAPSEKVCSGVVGCCGGEIEKAGEEALEAVEAVVAAGAEAVEAVEAAVAEADAGRGFPRGKRADRPGDLEREERLPFEGVRRKNESMVADTGEPESMVAGGGGASLVLSGHSFSGKPGNRFFKPILKSEFDDRAWETGAEQWP